MFYKNVFQSFCDNVFIMSNVNTLFTHIINIPLGGLMQANAHYYKINSNIY